MISAYLHTSLGTEITLNTAVAGANDTVIGSGTMFSTFFTMPSVFALYKVTGFEWLNGTVVNGSAQGVLHTIDANPPVSNACTLLAWSNAVTQAGASAVQRTSQVSSLEIKGGTLVAASLVGNSATGRYGTTTVAAGNRTRAIALNSILNAISTAWASGTEEPYIKVYAQPVL